MKATVSPMSNPPNKRDSLDGLRSIPDLWALYKRQPASVQEAYRDWWDERVETKAAHRDCLEPFLAGFKAGQGTLVRR